jgi:hypothetical protein
LTEDYRDMIYADTAAGIETPRKAFLRKWRLKCRAVADSLEEAGDRLFAFTRRDPTQWKSARTANAIERLNGELRRRIKTQTVLPCAKTVPMLPWALLASGQIQMRKVDGCETLSQPIEPMPLDLAARETDTSHAQRPPPGNFHSIRDTTRQRAPGQSRTAASWRIDSTSQRTPVREWSSSRLTHSRPSLFFST